MNKQGKLEQIKSNIIAAHNARSYLSDIPMIDYSKHSLAISVITEYIDVLEKEYKQVSGDKFFVWHNLFPELTS